MSISGAALQADAALRFHFETNRRMTVDVVLTDADGRALKRIPIQRPLETSSERKVDFRA